ncbi:MAG: LLM class flavin-dependent oxidoreductase, partial [Acidimicrobiales bacterium]|nr:LLM class flavin-dependent oxidoreductase [Acidimicrobiales bacterium]
MIRRGTGGTDGGRNSAVFIGGQSLLLECLNEYTGGGHKVHAVVTDDRDVRAWAEQRQIKVLSPEDDVRSELGRASFEYLFIVAHLEVLPPSIIELPLRAAVNFHDGPLPTYAGLNAPTWAIANSETTHAITWHEATASVDEGPIIHTETIAIEADDTSLTLNAKCFEAGAASFSEVVNKLEASAPREPQNRAGRKLYRRSDLPPAAVSVDWSSDASHIDAIVRALDFGPYPNPMATAKTWFNGVPLMLKSVRVETTASDLPPGTVIDRSGEQIKVSTTTNDLAIEWLGTVDGKPYDAPGLDRLGLIPGSRFDPPDDSHDSAFELTTELHRNERYWTDQLSRAAVVDLPQGTGTERRVRDLPALTTPPSLRASLENVAAGEQTDSVLGLVTLFLARALGPERGTIAFEPAGDLHPLISPFVPLSWQLSPTQTVEGFLRQFAVDLGELRNHERFARDLVHRHPELEDAADWLTAPRVALGGSESTGNTLFNAEGVALLLSVTDDGSTIRWTFDESRIDSAAVAMLHARFAAFVESVGDLNSNVSELNMLADDERELIFGEWIATDAPANEPKCLHQLVEEQALRTPDTPALVFDGRKLTYSELERRANLVAQTLNERGLGRGDRIAVVMPRSEHMVVALLGILKVGAAYVPLDPDYPIERLQFMVEDSGVVAILADSTASTLLSVDVETVLVDQIDFEAEASAAVPAVVADNDLAYMIYTSGSTGKPKGVMIEHRSVVNFCRAMDRRLQVEDPGVWLAVTSISFDISILELFWTLTRGFTVVLSRGDELPSSGTNGSEARPMDFSLFYFSTDERTDSANKYDLLLKGAKFADEHGFSAVWTPERHFHAFGGLYPNPAVAGAAIAAITESVEIRAGSCVLPLHHPARVAEEWAVVDNISGGRVGVSFASGWQPDDFVLLPTNYESRNDDLIENINTVKALWRGEARSFDGPYGRVQTETLPRPIQPELPAWLTAAGNPATFARAGAAGLNLLTHLLGQSVEELADKIKLYRKAWRDAGHPGSGHVSLMLHTLVSDDPTSIRDIVRDPMKAYLSSATNLIRGHASTFPAFRGATSSAEVDELFDSMSDADREALLEHSFNRYYETSGLFGSPESCLVQIQRLKGLGVD